MVGRVNAGQGGIMDSMDWRWPEERGEWAGWDGAGGVEGSK